VINLRTISRAIVTLLLSAAFVLMSVASGLHELAHLTQHARAVRAGIAANGAGIGLHDHIEQACFSQDAAPGSEFCFFCTFGSSATFTVTTVQFDPGLISLPSYDAPVQPDLLAHATVLPSLRAPPFTA
jgi:hypothetical protein